MELVELLPLLSNLHRTTRGFLASCPAHDDRHPSLVVTEAGDRILVHCRAGCNTREVLSALGLNYSDLFLDHNKPNRTTHRNGPRQPGRLPLFNWNWRNQCAELEREVQVTREHAEAMLAATQGLDVSILTDLEFDEVMDYVATAYSWLDRSERLDETLFMVQHSLRIAEQEMRVKDRREKVAV